MKKELKEEIRSLYKHIFHLLEFEEILKWRSLATNEIVCKHLTYQEILENRKIIRELQERIQKIETKNKETK